MKENKHTKNPLCPIKCPPQAFIKTLPKTLGMILYQAAYPDPMKSSKGPKGTAMYRRFYTIL